MGHQSSLERLREIKKRGIEAAQTSINQALASEDTQMGFRFLINQARTREEQALVNLAPQYKNQIMATGKLNLNEIITEIDNQYNFKALLAGGRIEDYLRSKGYSLEAKGSKSEQNKTDAEKAQALTTPLPPDIQEQLLQHITERFKEKIISQITVSGTNIRQLYAPIIKATDTYFSQLISTHVNATGLTIDNLDLGSLTIKINTNKMKIYKGRVRDNNGNIDYSKMMVDLSKFEISSAGEFFEHMAPIAQQLLYAIMQDEVNGLKNNKHLIEYINAYNSPTNIRYLQDMTVSQTMDILRDAILNVCPAALNAFNTYGELIAYKGAKANLRGGLGELRVLCIVEQMFPGQNYSAEGLSKIIVGTSSEKESPVDAAMTLIAENLKIGFQSKNTMSNIYSWSVSKSDAMDMPSFYSQRLNETLDGAEEQFFNTYSYNQPISPYGDYATLWAEFTNNSVFLSKFNALAYKIIRQEIQDVSKVSFVNDFFFMNDKLILSSSILESMLQTTINAVNNQTFSGKATSKNGELTTSFSYETNKNLVWTEENGYDNDGNPIFSAGSASNVMINYSINLNVNKLASMAISSFNP